jgi:hypothetical protein
LLAGDRVRRVQGAATATWFLHVKKRQIIPPPGLAPAADESAHDGVLVHAALHRQGALMPDSTRDNSFSPARAAPAAEQAKIAVEDLSAWFGAEPVLKSVRLDVRYAPITTRNIATRRMTRSVISGHYG